MCRSAIALVALAAWPVPTSDDYATRRVRWVPNDPPTWNDPTQSERNLFFADEVDCFREWNGDPAVGVIGHIRRLGIHPVGTHSPAVASNSLALAWDERSGGSPRVYFSHSLPGAAWPIIRVGPAGYRSPRRHHEL